MSLRKVALGLYVLLLAWFTLDLIGLPGVVTRDDWLSPAGLLELALILILIGYLRRWKGTPFLMLVTLGLWGYLQYQTHWRGFLLGTSSDQLKRYYAFFYGMARFFPESKTRITPDAYHTVLGLLIAVNLASAIIQILSQYGFHIRQNTKPTNRT